MPEKQPVPVRVENENIPVDPAVLRIDPVEVESDITGFQPKCAEKAQG